MNQNTAKTTDDTWEDWEVAADAGLEPVVPKKDLNPKINAKSNQLKKIEIVNQSSKYTEYVPPVRLLARPKANPQAQEAPKAQSTSDLNKILTQRQEDYQKARDRIFNSENKPKS